MLEKYLEGVIDTNWTKWVARDTLENDPIITHCNGFVADVCRDLGYPKFIDSNGNAFLANSMIAIMEADQVNWISTPQATGIETLVIAARKEKEHGHVCVCLFGDYVKSGKWGGLMVPPCANIGKSNFWNDGVNYAFAKPPTYYIYKGVINIPTGSI